MTRFGGCDASQLAHTHELGSLAAFTAALRREVTADGGKVNCTDVYKVRVASFENFVLMMLERL